MKLGLGSTVLAGALALAGCVESSMVARARLDIEQGLPGASFDRGHAFRLGRISTAMLMPIALWALEDGEEELEVVRSIRRVDFAVYEVRSFPDSLDDRQLAEMSRRLRRRGWSQVVRTRDAGEATWVFSRENGAGEVRDLFVVAVDDVEMVMVRVGGRLDRTLAALVAADPAGFGALLSE